MNIKNYSLLLLGMLALTLTAQSQARTLKLDIAYKAAMPLGNFKKLTDKTALNGWEAGLLYNITDQAALGFQTGFQDFYQKYPRQVYHGAGSAISAVISNSIQVIPLLLKGKYLFTQAGVVQPFVALGVGGGLVQYSKYYGQFPDAHSGFSFLAQPEVGVHIPVGQAKRVGINLAASYSYLPYKGLDADGLHHGSLKGGISVPLRQ